MIYQLQFTNEKTEAVIGQSFCSSICYNHILTLVCLVLKPNSLPLSSPKFPFLLQFCCLGPQTCLQMDLISMKGRMLRTGLMILYPVHLYWLEGASSAHAMKLPLYVTELPHTDGEGGGMSSGVKKIKHLWAGWLELQFQACLWLVVWSYAPTLVTTVIKNVCEFVCSCLFPQPSRGQGQGLFHFLL